jgi:16S rRNA processing protein RimM
VGKKGPLLIGKVVGVHGLKGNIKVYSYAESVSVFKPGSQLVLKTAGGGKRPYTINWVKPHSKTILLSLKEVENHDLAKALVGAEIFIEKASLPELEDGTYYWFDIIGLSVFTVEGEYIGCVDSVFPTGSNDVFVVKDPARGSNYEKLIPALGSVIISIDLEKKTIQVDLPKGL